MLFRHPEAYGKYSETIFILRHVAGRQSATHTLLPDIPVNINGFTPQNFSLQFRRCRSCFGSSCTFIEYSGSDDATKIWCSKVSYFSEANRLKTINRPASHYGLSLILGGRAPLWDVTNAYAYMGRSLLQPSQTECSLPLADAEGSGESEVFASGKSTDTFQSGAAWQTFNAYN